MSKSSRGYDDDGSIWCSLSTDKSSEGHNDDGPIRCSLPIGKSSRGHYDDSPIQCSLPADKSSESHDNDVGFWYLKFDPQQSKKEKLTVENITRNLEEQHTKKSCATYSASGPDARDAQSTMHPWKNHGPCIVHGQPWCKGHFSQLMHVQTNARHMAHTERSNPQ